MANCLLEGSLIFKPPMKKKIQIHSILIIQTAFIGDVILATALVEKLRRFYPECTIDFMCRKGNESVLDGNPNIRKVLVWDKKTDKYGHWKELLREVKQQRYDLLVNLQRFASMGLFTTLSKAKIKVGFRKNPFSALFKYRVSHEVGDGTHEISRNQQLILPWTDEKPCMPRLYPSEADKQKIAELQQGTYICIAPASVWYTKQYPTEKWCDLIRHLDFKGKIYLLGAPNDAELVNGIISETNDNRLVNLCGKLSLLQSAALMKGAILNYVNDSAPLHLASAMDAPVAAIFCSTIPQFGFGPLSSFKRIIQIKESLPCRPCGLHGFKDCPKGHFDCAFKIDTMQLVKALSDARKLA